MDIRKADRFSSNCRCFKLNTPQEKVIGVCIQHGSGEISEEDGSGSSNSSLLREPRPSTEPACPPPNPPGLQTGGSTMGGGDAAAGGGSGISAATCGPRSWGHKMPRPSRAWSRVGTWTAAFGLASSLLFLSCWSCDGSSPQFTKHTCWRMR